MNLRQTAWMLFGFGEPGFNWPVRKLAKEFKLSKSSVDRHRQSFRKRRQDPESELWETERGYRFLLRLVLATLFIFNLQRGVGVDKIAQYFKLLRLDRHLGVSSTSLGKLVAKMENQVTEFGHTHEKEAAKTSTERLIVAGVDETWQQDMMLVMMDLNSGYLLVETDSAKRDTETWTRHANSALKRVNGRLLYLVSDRAKALIALAAKLQVPYVTDLFHMMQEITKSYSIAIEVRLQQTLKAWNQAQLGLEALLQSNAQHPSLTWVNLQRSQSKVLAWQETAQDYHFLKRQFSLAVHPFNALTNQSQTSAEVHVELDEVLHDLGKIIQKHEIPDRYDALKHLRAQLKDLSASIDLWWAFCLQQRPLHWSEEFFKWVVQTVLPYCYWQLQKQKTDTSSLRNHYQETVQLARNHLENHESLRKWTVDEIQEAETWARDTVAFFQRASSAVEGRNGFLSQFHHTNRGLSKKRMQSLTVIHNFELKREDGATAANRFYKRDFPDLFEWLLSQAEELPLPRKRKKRRTAKSLILDIVPA